MVASGPVRLRRFGLGIFAGCGATIAASVLFGPGIAMAIAVLSFLASVLVADDGAGTFFPLALLFTIAVAVVLMMFIAAVAVNL